MSIIATNAAWRIRGLTSTERLTLLRLADYADDSGLSWPSIAAITRDTELSKSGVCKALKSLEEKGAIQRERGSAIQRKSTRYKINLAAENLSTTRTSPTRALVHTVDMSTQETSPQDAPSSPHGGQPSPHGGQGLVHTVDQNHHKNHHRTVIEPPDGGAGLFGEDFGLEPESPKTPRRDLAAEAKQIWDAYPAPGRANSSSRADVEKAWRATKPRPPVAEVIEGIRGWEKCDLWRKDGGQYIKGPHRWIKNRSWESIPTPRREIDIGGREPTRIEDIGPCEEIPDPF